MKIQTFSIVVGGKKCNAQCPYCVSKMTGGDGIRDCRVEDINVRNFNKACIFAKQSGVSTVLLTGKGEPLLYPDFISAHLKDLMAFDFPFIELQTNGIELPKMEGCIYGSPNYLKSWYQAGLTTICLSCVHWIQEYNNDILGSKYGYGGYQLSEYIKICHDNGFSVRVSCVMVKDYIDSLQKVVEFVDWCREHEVEQFTARPVSMPEVCDDQTVAQWTREHLIDSDVSADMKRFFDKNGTLLLKLAHGANVYDYRGQNVSVSNCLTHSPDPDDIRQLIYFPDGHLRYSWTNKGAIII